jgi:hypothetical protein
MTLIFSLRRSLLVLVVAAGLCLGSGLVSAASAASAAAAHVQAPARHRTLPSSRTADSPLAPLWHVLHSVWEAVGSSMDPLGNH